MHSWYTFFAIISGGGGTRSALSTCVASESEMNSNDNGSRGTRHITAPQPQSTYLEGCGHTGSHAVTTIDTMARDLLAK